MNKTQLQKVRDALWLPENSTDEEFAQFSEAFAILDRELAKPEPEPEPEPEPVVYWDGDRSVIPADEVSYIPNWTDYYPTPLYRHPAPQSTQPDSSEAEYAKLGRAMYQMTTTVHSPLIPFGEQCDLIPHVWQKFMDEHTAPPSREWQGLTNEEIDDWKKTLATYSISRWCIHGSHEIHMFARAIEDAVWRKNYA